MQIASMCNAEFTVYIRDSSGHDRNGFHFFNFGRVRFSVLRIMLCLLKHTGTQCRLRSDCSLEQSDLGLQCLHKNPCPKFSWSLWQGYLTYHLMILIVKF